MERLELVHNGIIKGLKGFMKRAKLKFRKLRALKCNFAKTSSVNTASCWPPLPLSISAVGDSSRMVGGSARLGLGYYGRSLAKNWPQKWLFDKKSAMEWPKKSSALRSKSRIEEGMLKPFNGRDDVKDQIFDVNGCLEGQKWV